jgi:hypothetical protein
LGRNWEGYYTKINQNIQNCIREKSDLFSARQIYTASVMATKGRCLLCSSRETYPSWGLMCSCMLSQKLC